METRANNALIGLFTLGVVAAACAFVLWFARAADSIKVVHYNVVFIGSISGLSVGSNVLFNGIRVGQVDTLDLMPNDPSRVVASITVKDTTPVKTDTRARMEFQGLTGGAYIQLYGGSASAPPLTPPPNAQVATLLAERSELQNLVDGARDTVTQASQTLARLDEFLRTNEGSVTNTIGNVQTFTKALSDNSKNVSDFLASTGQAAKSITKLSETLNNVSLDAEAIIKAVDPDKVNRILTNVTNASDALQATVKAVDADKINAVLANVQAFSQTLADARAPLTNFATQASALSASLNQMAPKLETGLDNIDAITKSIDGAKIASTVDNVNKFTATLGNNSDEINAFIKDARHISGDLSAMTPKLAAALDTIDALTKAVDTGKVASTVDNVNKFAAVLGNNSDRVNSFMTDAGDIGRKLNATADRIDAVVKNIDTITSDPSSKGMFAEITKTAQAIRQLATDLDTRTANLSKNLDAFSGAGLRDYQQLAVQGQSAIKNLQRTLDSLQRNPQQLIFGGKSNIPEYGK